MWLEIVYYVGEGLEKLGDISILCQYGRSFGVLNVKVIRGIKNFVYFGIR